MKSKKIIAYIMALAMFSFSGCSNSSSSTHTVYHTTANTTESTSPTKSDTEASATSEETSTEAETESTTEELPLSIQTDNSAIVTNNSDGSFNVLFEDTMCTMTFPASWAGRVLIEDDMVYSKKCSDSVEGRNAGKLFTMMSTSDMDSFIPDSFLLGTDEDEYVLAFKPTDCDYDPSITEIQEEFASLGNDLESVILSAKCESSPEFKPMNMNIYDSPGMYSIPFAGTWEESEAIYSGSQFSPFIGFRANDGLFAYSYGLNGADSDSEFGNYIINTNFENYQWYAGEWGETGLIFLDGCIYSFIYYPTAPMTMSLEKLGGNSEYEISDRSWILTSDFQNFDADYND